MDVALDFDIEDGRMVLDQKRLGSGSLGLMSAERDPAGR